MESGQVTRQHRRIIDSAGRDFRSLNLQRPFVDPNVYLPPNPAFRVAILATLHSPSLWDLMPVLSIRLFSGPLPHDRTGPRSISFGGGRVCGNRDFSIQTNQSQQALSKPCRRPRCGSVVKPGSSQNQTKSKVIRAASTLCYIRRRVRGPVVRWGPIAHDTRLSRWVHTVDPHGNCATMSIARLEMQSYMETKFC